jgi:pimeloyl-ACP methyl ester carboxylesterase
MMESLPWRDGQLTYSQAGKGTPVILVHGFCEDSYIWEDLRSDLLEENYRVICIDLPGFRRSTPQGDRIEDYAAAVLAVAEELKLDPFVLLGHSMGGYTALAVAEQAPQRLLGLGLLHSHPYADPPEKQASRLKSVDFIERYGHEMYVKQLVPKLFAPRYAMSHRFLVDKLIFRAARYPLAGIANALRAMAARPDRSAVLSEMTCPVLFINGELDEAVPEDYRRDQLPLPALAQIHTFSKVAHMGLFEAAREVELAVRQFVAFCEECQAAGG